MNIESKIILAILVIIMIPAIKSSIRHMLGEGSCCGGPKEKPKKKKIKGKKIETLLVPVEGMRCTNCQVRLQNHLNELDGVVAKVSLEKKIAKLDLYQPVSREVIDQTIEHLGYKVV